LLVTHDVALAARFADRTIRLADGRIVAHQQAQTTA
jgi:ABC-type hemin transport system ATPase subunit